MKQYLNYGQALELLKQGKFLTRKGWNGKGMFVYMVPGHTFEKSLARGIVGIIAAELVSPTITYRDHLDMRYADGTFGVWLASQSDQLETDWYEIETGDLSMHVRGTTGG